MSFGHISSLVFISWKLLWCMELFCLYFSSTLLLANSRWWAFFSIGKCKRAKFAQRILGNNCSCAIQSEAYKFLCSITRENVLTEYWPVPKQRLKLACTSIWSDQSLLSEWRNIESLAIQNVLREDSSDQDICEQQRPRLAFVFAVCDGRLCRRVIILQCPMIL